MKRSHDKLGEDDDKSGGKDGKKRKMMTNRGEVLYVRFLGKQHNDTDRHTQTHTHTRARALDILAFAKRCLCHMIGEPLT